MKFKVTYATNFMRILKLPDEFPSDYCFDGGHLIGVRLVDWFNPFPQDELWAGESKELDSADPQYSEHVEKIKEFVKGKRYFEPKHTYVALTDYGDVFVINPERRANELQRRHDLAIQEQKKEIKNEGRRKDQTTG